VRVLLDFLAERFAQVSGELEGLLGLPALRPLNKSARSEGL